MSMSHPSFTQLIVSFSKIAKLCNCLLEYSKKKKKLKLVKAFGTLIGSSQTDKENSTLLQCIFHGNYSGMLTKLTGLVGKKLFSFRGNQEIKKQHLQFTKLPFVCFFHVMRWTDDFRKRQDVMKLIVMGFNFFMNLFVARKL